MADVAPLIDPFVAASAMVAFVVLVLAFAGWSHWFGAGKAKRETQAREVARLKDWVRVSDWRFSETPHGGGYQIEGPTWRVIYDADPGGDSPSPNLKFIAALPSAGWHWTIHDRKTHAWTNGAIGRWLSGKLIGIVGEVRDVDAARAFQRHAVDLPLAHAEFRRRYVVSATDSRWSQLISSEAANQMLNWPTFDPVMSVRDNGFSAQLDAEQLTVKLYARDPSLAVVRQLVELGKALQQSATALLLR
jgi:hypothetical protein